MKVYPDNSILNRPFDDQFQPRIALETQAVVTLLVMSIKALNEQEVIHEAMTVLLEHMEPAKVAKFLASRPVHHRDYVKLREQLFAGETVDSLLDKIRAFEQTEGKR